MKALLRESIIPVATPKLRAFPELRPGVGAAREPREAPEPGTEVAEGFRTEGGIARSGELAVAEAAEAAEA